MGKFLMVVDLVGMTFAIGSGFSSLAFKKVSADMDKAGRDLHMLEGIGKRWLA